MIRWVEKSYSARHLNSTKSHIKKKKFCASKLHKQESIQSNVYCYSSKYAHKYFFSFNVICVSFLVLISVYDFSFITAYSKTAPVSPTRYPYSFVLISLSIRDIADFAYLLFFDSGGFFWCTIICIFDMFGATESHVKIMWFYSDMKDDYSETKKPRKSEKLYVFYRNCTFFLDFLPYTFHIMYVSTQLQKVSNLLKIEI